MMEEAKSPKDLEEYPNPIGLGPMLEGMLNSGIPISLENYLELNGMPWEEMDGESQASIPRVLFDPRLKELKPSERNYATLVGILADPGYSNLTVDEMRDELDHW